MGPGYSSGAVFERFVDQLFCPEQEEDEEEEVGEEAEKEE